MLEQITNNAQSTTTGSINNSSDPVTFSVASAANFPTSGNFRVIIDGEILLVTSVSGTSFTAARAQENTTIATHSSGATVTHLITAESLKSFIQRHARRDYPIFTPTGVDDEFDDESFSGWTAINDGLHVPTVTEISDSASFSLPGGDASGHLNAYMKSVTVSANDIIEIAMRGNGVTQTFNIAGLLMADGLTYNAGAQVGFYWSPNEQRWGQGRFTGYNSFTAVGTFPTPENRNIITDMFIRLKYEGSNNWSGYQSADGISWTQVISFSATLTPTAVGFFVTTWGGANPFIWNARYFRKH